MMWFMALSEDLMTGVRGHTTVRSLWWTSQSTSSPRRSELPGQESFRQMGWTCPHIPSGPAAFLLCLSLKLFHTLCHQTAAACLSHPGCDGSADSGVASKCAEGAELFSQRGISSHCPRVCCFYSPLYAVVPVISILNSQSVVIVTPVSSSSFTALQMLNDALYSSTLPVEKFCGVCGCVGLQSITNGVIHP